jgi:hypothetical protein
LNTNVYIDGFNFYYGALRNTPYRWLNPEALCQLLLPKNTISQIKYFTALVSARPNDLDQPLRQQLYLRALATLPKVGYFEQSEKDSGWSLNWPLIEQVPPSSSWGLVKHEVRARMTAWYLCVLDRTLL